PTDPDHNILFAGHLGDGSFGGGGVYRSTDGGATWQLVSNELPDLPATAGGTGGHFNLAIGTRAFAPIEGQGAPAQPNAQAVAGTGQLAPGNYQSAVTFVNTAGVESNLSPVRAVTVPAAQHRVDLTNIEVGPPGTAARNIYRTDPGGTDLRLIRTIENNSNLP